MFSAMVLSYLKCKTNRGYFRFVIRSCSVFVRFTVTQIRSNYLQSSICQSNVLHGLKTRTPGSSLCFSSQMTTKLLTGRKQIENRFTLSCYSLISFSAYRRLAQRVHFIDYLLIKTIKKFLDVKSYHQPNLCTNRIFCALYLCKCHVRGHFAELSVVFFIII